MSRHISTLIFCPSPNSTQLDLAIPSLVYTSENTSLAVEQALMSRAGALPDPCSRPPVPQVPPGILAVLLPTIGIIKMSGSR